MLSHNESLNKFQRTEIIQNMFFSRNRIKLEISNKKKTRKCPRSCKLNNVLINDLSVDQRTNQIGIIIS